MVEISNAGKICGAVANEMWGPRVLCILLVSTSMVSGQQRIHFIDNVITKVVNATIHKVALRMANIHKDSWLIDTQPQEFGRFELNMSNVTVEGFENAIGEIIKIKIWPLEVSNLTIYVPHLALHSADYTLDGYLPFPFTNKNITLSGSNGQVRVQLYDIRASVSLLPTLNGSAIWIEESKILLTSSAMTVNIGNLMGGGLVGVSFNTVLNDSALIAFDYFKDPLIAYYKDDINKFIGNAICTIMPFFCKTRNHPHKLTDNYYEVNNDKLISEYSVDVIT